MDKKISRRNLLKSALVGSLVGLTGLTSCDFKKIDEKKEFTLKVSEFEDHEENFIIYCGMPNKESFSLSNGKLYSATNLYYSRDSKQILFSGNSYNVISVDPNHITLRKINK